MNGIFFLIQGKNLHIQQQGQWEGVGKSHCHQGFLIFLFVLLLIYTTEIWWVGFMF